MRQQFFQGFMSSGTGLQTKHGRCFPFYLRMMECLQDSPEPKMTCPEYAEDYLECLHGTKEKERLIRILTELEKQEKEKGKKY